MKRFYLYFVSLPLILMIAIPAPLFGDLDVEENGTDLDRIKSELASRTVSYEFVDTRFREVINRIRQQVSFNIIVDSSVDQQLESPRAKVDKAGFGDEPAGGGTGNRFGRTDTGFGGDGGSSRGFGRSPGDAFDPYSDTTNRGFGSRGTGPKPAGGFEAGDGPNEASHTNNRVTIRLEDVSLKRALKLILDRKDLTAIYKHGAVQIVPQDHARNLEVRMYDVRDLQYQLTDFKTELGRFHTGYSDPSAYGESSDSGYTGTSSIFQPDLNRSEEVITNKERFMELVRNNVGTRTAWDNSASMQMMNGILVVNQTPELHKQIDFLIHRLRQYE